MWRPGRQPGRHRARALLRRRPRAGRARRGPRIAAPTVARRERAFRVAPIVFCEPSELLARAEAERELGIEPGGRTCSSSSARGRGPGRAVGRCLRTSPAGPASRSPRSPRRSRRSRELPTDVVQLQLTYPMSRYCGPLTSRVGRLRLQRLPRAGPLRRADAVRADAAARPTTRPRAPAGRRRAGPGRGVEGPGGPETWSAALDSLLDDARRAGLPRRSTGRVRPGERRRRRGRLARRPRQRPPAQAASRRARACGATWRTGRLGARRRRRSLRRAPRHTARSRGRR